MSEAEKAPAIEPEQAADLRALQAGATVGAPVPEGVAEGDAPGEVKPPSAAALQMSAMAVGMLRPLICYAVPTLRDAPDELWAPVPEGVAAVMDHYGASAEWMQSPWARLGLSLAPLAAYAAMTSIEQAKKKPQVETVKPKPEPVPGEASKTVTFGDPVTP